MDYVVKKLNITDIEGFQKITISTIHEFGGAGLLPKYQQSLDKLLISMFPEYKKACIDSVMRLVNNLKLNKIEDVINISSEYHLCALVIVCEK